MSSISLHDLKKRVFQLLLFLSVIGLPKIAQACDGSDFVINGIVDNGDGTYTIDMDIVIAGFDHPGGIFGGTMGFFFSVDQNIQSISPTDLTSANGTTLSGVIGGMTVSWGNPGAGPFFVAPTDPTQTFNVLITVVGRPMSWSGGGQELNNCIYSGIFPCPLATLMPIIGDQTICEGQSATLAVLATGEDIVIWSPDGQVGSTITVSPTVTTTYTAVATNDCGDTPLSFTVTVDPLPLLTDLTGDQIICDGDTTILSILSLYEDVLVWIPTGETDYVISVSPNMNTTYTVMATNACGTDQLDINVDVIQLPTVIPDQLVATICEGDNVILGSTSTNADFIAWTPGASNSNTLIDNPTTTTVYSVEVGNACGFDTAMVTVYVNQDPEIIGLTPDQTICDGESVTLTVDTSNVTQINWTPSGEVGTTLTDSPTTTTNYTVQVSNACGDTTSNVTVTVDEDPTLSIVNGDQSICDNGMATLTVTAINADSVVWQPGGTVGNSISVSPSTTTVYSATAYNDCGDVSEIITVTLLPDVTASLTLETCEGTTANYQGTSLAIGSVTDFTLVGSNGCDSIVTVTVDQINTLTSSLTLETCDGTTTTYQGTSLAIGSVTDFTLVSASGCDSVVTVTVNGINILTSSLTLEACNGTDAIYQGTSLAIGSVTDFDFIASNGCDSVVTVTVDGLPLFTTSLTLEACDGNTADYNGNALAIGSTTDFLFTAQNGCDSTVSVSVNGLQNFTTPLTLETCDGTTADYNGNALAIGSTTDFMFTAQNGCDSTVTVSVNGLQNFTTPLTLEACNGTTADYNGNALAIGSTTDFMFTAQNGCDSTVTVSVNGLQNFMTPLTLDACDGTTADYNGNALAIGSTTDFMFTAQNGCDSTVTVSVNGLQNFATPLTLDACDGNTADYNGNALAIGSTTDFVFPAANGCDSTVTVSVDGLPTFTSNLTLQTCDGTTTTYQGSTLAIGSTTPFTLTAENGCDSVVTVSVDGISTFTSSLTLETCDGTTATYQSTSLAIGTTTDFTFVSSSGCDSIVSVSVDGISAFYTSVNLEACQGDDAIYNGTPLAIGTSTDFLFAAASGCDSIVTVAVMGLNTYATPINLTACQGDDAVYNGNSLAIGTITDFPFTAENGCDSIVTVEVMGLDTYTTSLQLQTCLGTDAIYNGTPLSAGTVTDFNLTASNGCDSLVTVSVMGIDVIRTSLSLETCDGTQATYNGTMLDIGTATEFMFTASNGCDSVVTVSVNGVSISTSSVVLDACEGTTADYNGNPLPIGSSTDFTFLAASGCDSIVTVVVQSIPNFVTSLQLETCDGTQTTYNGQLLDIGSVTDFNFTAANGCDSVVTVSVSGLSIFTGTLQLEACEGTSAVYNGQSIAVGNSADFTLVSSNGCDSILTVSVGPLPVFASDLQLQTCVGTEAVYNGQNLAIGSTTDFTLTANNGCDSVVTVSVAGLSILTTAVQLEACDGTDAIYNGTPLTIGSTTDFNYIASSGCDSIVTVSVNGLQNFATPVQLEACQGTNAIYNGTPLAIGSSTDFMFPAANGCDSVVTVSVSGLEVFASTLELEACDGTTAAYQGQQLAIGTTTDVPFTAINGCDSIVTVSVVGLQIFNTPLTLQACDGSMANYNGTMLDIGTTTDFPFISSNGCDSIVSVLVQGLEVFASTLNLEACDGTSAAYNGQSLAIGSTTDFTLTANNGCDSVVTVSVEGLQVYMEDLVLETCEGTSVTFDGMEIQPGGNMDFTYTSALGCDSIVTVFALDIIPLSASDEEITICDGDAADIFGEMISVAGSYSDVFVASNGCDSTHVIVLDVLEPILLATSSESSCPDENTGMLTSQTTGGMPPYNFMWSNGATTETVDNVAAGNYILTVTDAMGCSQIIDETVTSHDVQVDVMEEDATCFDFSDGNISIIEPDPEWTFSLNGTPFTSTSVFPSLPAGNYTLQTQDIFGCIYEQSLEVDHPNPFVLDLPEDTIIQLGQIVPVNVNYNWFGPLDLVWNTTVGLNCDTCLNVQARPLESTLYTLLATNENGCSADDQMFITVQNKLEIFIPNIFSPNGDGINDVLTIFSGNNVEEITDFKVFSRWGELLHEDAGFQPNDPSHSWNGVFKGDLLNPGVFVYFAEVKFIDGKVRTFKGDVTLMR